MKKTSFGKIVALTLSIAGAALVFGAGGCGSAASDRCKAVCQCEDCGERELNQCQLEAQTFLDIADSYNCSNAIDAYFNCEIQKHQCMDGHYQDDDMQCMMEHSKLQTCLDSNSNNRHGAYIPDGFTFSMH